MAQWWEHLPMQPSFNSWTRSHVGWVQGCCLRKLQGAHKAKSLEFSNPACEVLGAAAKNLGAQSISLGGSGYRPPVRQQSWSLSFVLALLWEIFLWVLKFYSLLKNQRYQIPIWFRIWGSQVWQSLQLRVSSINPVSPSGDQHLISP